MNIVLTELAKVGKAIASGSTALLGSIVLALDLQPADHQGIQYLSQAQWGVIILGVLASFGLTWRVPNKPGELPGEVTTVSDPTPRVVAQGSPLPPKGGGPL